MASRKMTFTIPEEVAAQFVHRIPARDRSQYVARALAARLRERDERMIRACEIANADPDLLRIEQDWDELRDEADRVEEPWNVAQTR
jgi:hypothetical protein